LVNDGYVDKVIDPEDKRGYILSITEKGKKVALTIIDVLDEWDQLMNSFLEQNEKEFLSEIHKKVYLKLREYFQEESIDE
jgi:DNA-binding MarR family transcriptional regulator